MLGRDFLIVCADLNMIKYGHVSFNSAMLIILQNVFKDHSIAYIGEERQIENIKNDTNLSLSKVKFIKKLDSTEGRKFKIFWKEFVEIINLMKVFYYYKKNNADLIILFSILPLTHCILKILKKFLPDIKMVIFLHGELEYMREKDKINLIFFGKILKCAISLRNDKNTFYFVLGESIQKNLVKYLNNNIQVLNIDHPYIFPSISNKEMDNNLLKFGCIGLAGIRKNSHFIFRLGHEFKDYINSKEAMFEIIGMMDSTMDLYVNQLVKYQDIGEMLNSDEFEKKVKNIDYAIFFYDNSHYSLCASGAFFDAIKYEKPIIAIKNDFFEAYFDKLGNIGYLCNDYEELKKKVEWIVLNKPVQEYQDQVANIRIAKHSILSIDSVQDDLKKKLKRANLYG